MFYELLVYPRSGQDRSVSRLKLNSGNHTQNRTPTVMVVSTDSGSGLAIWVPLLPAK